MHPVFDDLFWAIIGVGVGGIVIGAALVASFIKLGIATTIIGGIFFGLIALVAILFVTANK
jgi:hypothetical protein